MNDNNLGCVIYDFQDLGKYAGAEYHTFGDWLSVTYNGGSDEQRPARRKTRFTLTLFS